MSSVERRVECRAPAKVNLALRVLGRRADGYHELESIMAPVSLYDRIVLSAAANPRRGSISCKVAGPVPAPSGQGNLAWQAADRVLEALELSATVRISIEKHIPAQAGLGGGSSDAATVLRRLPRLLGRRLSPEQSHTLAKELGADVPFFLSSRPSIASGIGEVLEPLASFPRLALVIAVPPVGVDTAWAYANALPTAAIRPVGKAGARRRSLRAAGLQLSFERLLSRLSNDFESGVSAAVGDVGRVRGRLLEFGALHAVMSGSGSAMVGVFESLQHARDVAGEFGRGDRAYAVRVLSRPPAIGARHVDGR
jgi:4-diphosphocytidyl-2-C-methyl-D-erythritol kinase